MKKIILICSISILTIALAVVGIFLIPNIQNNERPIVIHNDNSYQDVLTTLQSQDELKCNFSFKIAAWILQYPSHIRNGKYFFEPKENNLSMIIKLRKGQHYPVKFTFNNIRTKQQFVEKVGQTFMFEPEELAQLLDNPEYLSSLGFNPQNCVAMFIPNSYEFYYNISAEEFVEKMHHYYEQFWTNERQELAQSIELSPIEVVTLASIVEEENFKEGEKAIIAGLYLNRLQRGMKLQADPTVKFALGDFAKKRIYLVDTQYDSPYNTYVYEGLPPGPIRIPATSTVDSVLHYMPHDYIYMCAKEDFSGNHNFAVTAREHERNAAKYHKALDQLKIETTK